MENNQHIVILPCAGSGNRFEHDVPKQYAKINNKTILEYTLDTFLSISEIDQILLVVAKEDNYIEDILSNYPKPKIKFKRAGGDTRAISVKNGLNSINCSPNDWILVHDVARCCISKDAITKLVKELEHDEIGGILALPATDTIKQIDHNNSTIKTTLDRNKVYLAQTPQMFRYHVLKKAYVNMGDNVTDDASLVEKLGLKIKLILGEPTNIKITYPFDLELAKLILNQRNRQP